MAASLSQKPRRIPKLCRYKGTGQGVVRLNGVDIYCGVHDSPEAKEKYDRVIAEWLQSGRTLPVGAADFFAASVSPSAQLLVRISIAELIVAYKTHAEDYYRDAPIERRPAPR